MTKRLLFLICFLLSINFLISGQIRNKIDILTAYKSNIYYSSFPKDYRNNLGVKVPTVLGNLKSNQGFCAEFLYSYLSFNYQPGIIISYNSYTVNSSLIDLYDNLKLTTASFGLINKFNFLKYGHHRIIPYTKLNLYFNSSKMKNNESIKTIIEEGQSPNTNYSTELRTPQRDLTFFSPTIEVSLGSETKLSDRVYFFLELALAMTNYPDFDSKSPMLFKEGNFLCYNWFTYT
jgi:hypothetical protein